MSFLKKHIGTTASKFEFEFWIDDVIGYSTANHSAEGIYCVLLRNNKSYKTKVAVPENGGYVHVNECIKFTSTLYQKKKRHENISSMLPKPFILRVCDAKHATIRWQTALDLSEYATSSGRNTQESLTLQFAGRSSSTKSPAITLRLRVTSRWLNNVANLSQSVLTSPIKPLRIDARRRLSISDEHSLSETVRDDLDHQPISRNTPTPNASNGEEHDRVLLERFDTVDLTDSVDSESDGTADRGDLLCPLNEAGDPITFASPLNVDRMSDRESRESRDGADECSRSPSMDSVSSENLNRSIPLSEPSTNGDLNEGNPSILTKKGGEESVDTESENADYPKVIQLVLDHCIDRMHSVPVDKFKFEGVRRWDWNEMVGDFVEAVRSNDICLFFLCSVLPVLVSYLCNLFRRS